MQTDNMVIAGIVTVFAAGGVFVLWLAYDMAMGLYKKIKDYIDLNM